MVASCWLFPQPCSHWSFARSRPILCPIFGMAWQCILYRSYNAITAGHSPRYKCRVPVNSISIVLVLGTRASTCTCACSSSSSGSSSSSSCSSSVSRASLLLLLTITSQQAGSMALRNIKNAVFAAGTPGIRTRLGSIWLQQSGITVESSAVKVLQVPFGFQDFAFFVLTGLISVNLSVNQSMCTRYRLFASVAVWKDSEFRLCRSPCTSGLRRFHPRQSLTPELLNMSAKLIHSCEAIDISPVPARYGSRKIRLPVHALPRAARMM